METTVTMTVTEVEDELPPVGDSACPTGLAFGDSDDSFGVPTRGSKNKIARRPKAYQQYKGVSLNGGTPKTPQNGHF